MKFGAKMGHKTRKTPINDGLDSSQGGGGVQDLFFPGINECVQFGTDPNITPDLVNLNVVSWEEVFSL